MHLDIKLIVDAINYEELPIRYPRFENYTSLNGNFFSLVTHKRTTDLINCKMYIYARLYEEIRERLRLLQKTGVIFDDGMYSFRIISMKYKIRTGSGGYQGGLYRYLAEIDAEILPEA